jgi:hypothetical protein
VRVNVKVDKEDQDKGIKEDWTKELRRKSRS